MLEIFPRLYTNNLCHNQYFPISWKFSSRDLNLNHVSIPTNENLILNGSWTGDHRSAAPDFDRLEHYSNSEYSGGSVECSDLKVQPI